MSQSLTGRGLRTVAPKTADYTVTAADCGTIFTNEGASGTVVFSLPPATVGLWYTFIVHAAQALRVDPNGTEVAPIHTGVVQAAGKYVGSSTAGNLLSIVCIKAGEWRLLSATATWVAEG